MSYLKAGLIEGNQYVCSGAFATDDKVLVTVHGREYELLTVLPGDTPQVLTAIDTPSRNPVDDDGV